LEVVRELLSRGAAMAAARIDGWTPLRIASEKGHLEVVYELLARGALLGVVTNDG
jgi:ankyrin repeat protein